MPALTPGDVIAVTINGRRRLFESSRCSMPKRGRSLPAASIPKSSPCRCRPRPTRPGIPAALGPVQGAVLDLPSRVVGAAGPDAARRLRQPMADVGDGLDLAGRCGVSAAAIIPAPSTSGEPSNPLQAGAPGRWKPATPCACACRRPVRRCLMPACSPAPMRRRCRTRWRLEVLQFANAGLVDSGTCRLSRLLRGQAGSDYAVTDVLPPGAPFVLLDTRLVPLAKGLNALDRPILVRVHRHDDPLASRGTLLPLYAVRVKRPRAAAWGVEVRGGRRSLHARRFLGRHDRAQHLMQRVGSVLPRFRRSRISARRRAACTSTFRNVRHCVQGIPQLLLSPSELL